MAIGKQGAYATVEGGIVDFGKITTEAIDKYQTQQALQEKLKQEKAAAAAKLKVEREKVEVKLDKFAPITGQGGISDLISQDLKEMADDISSTKEAYNNGEVSLAKVRAKEDAYNQRIFEYKSASDLSKTKSEDWAKNADKYDPQSLEESSDQFKALLSGNFQPGKDAQGKRVYQKVERDANGNVTKVLDEYYSPMDIVTKYNPIPKFNQAEDIHNFTTQIAPLSKYTDFSGLTKITSETIAGNPKVTENIKSYVGNLLSDPNTLAVLNKERTGTYKRTVTDPAEIKATADWYESKLKDGYKESVEKDRHYVSPSGGDGGGGKKPLPMTPSSLYVMKPQEIELTNGGKVKVKANELIGYPASNTIYGKDETGTKQAVTLLKNKRTKELFIRTASAKTTSEGTGIKTGQVSETTSETSKKENYIYAGSHTASDDFLRLAEGYIGVTYTGKDGKKHTIESASIQELNKYIEARDSQVGMKNTSTKPTTTTKTKKTEAEQLGI